MIEHWRQNGPPVYMAVAGYLGLIKGDKGSQSGLSDEEKYGNLEELEQMFASTGGMIE